MYSGDSPYPKPPTLVCLPPDQELTRSSFTVPFTHVLASREDVEIAGMFSMTTDTVLTGPQRAAMTRLALVEFIQADPTFNSFLNFSVNFLDDRTRILLVSVFLPIRQIVSRVGSRASRITTFLLTGAFLSSHRRRFDPSLPKCVRQCADKRQ